MINIHCATDIHVFLWGGLIFQTSHTHQIEIGPGKPELYVLNIQINIHILEPIVCNGYSQILLRHLRLWVMLLWDTLVWDLHLCDILLYSS